MFSKYYQLHSFLLLFFGIIKSEHKKQQQLFYIFIKHRNIVGGHWKSFIDLFDG